MNAGNISVCSVFQHHYGEYCDALLSEGKAWPVFIRTSYQSIRADAQEEVGKVGIWMTWLACRYGPGAGHTPRGLQMISLSPTPNFRATVHDTRLPDPGLLWTPHPPPGFACFR
jgi:hypothetical protein